MSYFGPEVVWSLNRITKWHRIGESCWDACQHSNIFSCCCSLVSFYPAFLFCCPCAKNRFFWVHIWIYNLFRYLLHAVIIHDLWV